MNLFGVLTDSWVVAHLADRLSLTQTTVSMLLLGPLISGEHRYRVLQPSLNRILKFLFICRTFYHRGEKSKVAPLEQPSRLQCWRYDAIFEPIL